LSSSDPVSKPVQNEGDKDAVVGIAVGVSVAVVAVAVAVVVAALYKMKRSVPSKI
jgi:hypothetical protein